MVFKASLYVGNSVQDIVQMLEDVFICHISVIWCG